MTTHEPSEKLRFAQHCVEEGDLKTAKKIVDLYLRDDPNNILALTIMTCVMEGSENPHIAYHLAKRCTEIAPRQPSGWLNLGKACADLWRMKEAVRAYNKALGYYSTDSGKLMALTNISGLFIDYQEFKEARKYAEAALKIDPNHRKSRANLGFCQLAVREFEEGWKNYGCTIGTEWRRRFTYNDEPDWDGEKTGTLVLHGEQGIGDQICFASMVPDVKKLCDKLILDVDPRLVGLLRRSFPGVKVYGTLGHNELNWAPDDRKVDASYPMGQAGEFVRKRTEDFPVETFLKPCPNRTAMWKHLWNRKGKKVVGIAWRGGIPKTGAKYRQAELENWLPLFEAFPDVHFVSLQYKPSQHEIDGIREQYPVDLVEYPYATLTQDYDDTAALVASLDCVVSVPNTLWHTAGPIGTPLVAMKAKSGCWKTHGGLLFHPVDHWVEWKGSWKQSVTEAIPLVEKILGSSSGTTRDSLSPTTSCVTRSNGTAGRVSL